MGRLISLDQPQRQIWIERVCDAGQALWFKGDPPFPSETRHMFFVLGKLDSGDFVMVNATSQVEKCLSYLAPIVRPFGLTPQDVSVQLGAGSHSFITKDTLIDCRDPFMLSPEVLSQGEEFALFDVPPEPSFFVPLLRAWAASPEAIPAHLDQVRPQWAPYGIAF